MYSCIFITVYQSLNFLTLIIVLFVKFLGMYYGIGNVTWVSQKNLFIACIYISDAGVAILRVETDPLALFKRTHAAIHIQLSIMILYNRNFI